jgi:hypothetical protein
MSCGFFISPVSFSGRRFTSRARVKLAIAVTFPTEPLKSIPRPDVEKNQV